MNICLVTPIFPPEIGGPATYTYEIAQRWQHKHRINVVTLTPSPIPLNNVPVFHPRPDKVQKINNRIVHLWYRMWFVYRELFRVLVSQVKNSNLIYIQVPDLLGLMAVLLAKVYNKTSILRFVNDLAWENAYTNNKTNLTPTEFVKNPRGEIKYWMILQWERLIFRFSKTIIVPSKNRLRLLKEGHKVNRKKIVVIPNFVDFKKFRPLPKKEGFHIITISRLVRFKDLLQLIQGFIYLREKIPGITWSIIGDGPMKEIYAKEISKRRLGNNIFLLGRKSHDEVANLIGQFQVYLHNSITEGFPHTILEAMASKTLVIAKRSEGVDELIMDMENGILYDGEDVKELFSKILYASRDNNVSEVVGKAYQFALSYSPERIIKRLESVITGSVCTYS